MMRLVFGFVLLSGLIVLGCTDSANQKNLQPRTLTSQPEKDNRLPGQYIVTLKESTNSEILTEVFKQYGIKSIKDLARGRYLITLELDPGPEEITKQAATSVAIKAVQPNYIYKTTPFLNDDSQRQP